MRFAYFQLVFLLLAGCLAVDTLTGFMVSGMGLDLKLSALYKFFLLLVLLLLIACYSQRAIAVIFTLMMVLLIGPAIQLTNRLDASGFLFDFSYVIKILMPLIVFCYLAIMARKWPDLIQKYGKQALYLSFAILCFNLVAGALGYGFSSYGSEDNPDSSIGVKGFFYAGNEVSGLFILLFGLALHRAWNASSKGWYFLLCPIVVISGALIATKAAILSGVLMTALIPLVNERKRLMRLSWLKVSLSFPVVLAIGAIAYFIVPILEATGIWERIVWFYEKKGIIGIFLSGRNEYIITATAAFDQYADFWQHFFGIGTSGLTIIARHAVEVEPADLYFWFGLPGLFYLFFIFGFFIYISYQATLDANSKFAPYALMVNLLLLLLACIAGHTLTSGMLGPLLGLMNGLVYLDFLNGRTSKSVGDARHAASG